MAKQQLDTEGAPRPVGPYSQGMVAGSTVYCSGMVGLDPATGSLVEGSVAEQTERALRSVAAILESAGLSMADVVKTTCFLADIRDFAAFNEVYGRFFQQPYPARSTFQVAALPLGALVEIEAIAVRDGVAA